MAPRPRKPSAQKRRRRGTSRGSSREEENFDDSRFNSLESQEWYVRRANNTVLAEVDLDSNFDADYHFRDAFENMGWDSMLNLPRQYYPTLVRQFYANISNKTSLSCDALESFVKGVPIALCRRTLAEILGATDEGPVFEHGKYIVKGDPTWQFELTLPKYSSSWASFKTVSDLVTGDVRMEAAPIPTKSLSLRHSLLVYLFNHNILPASSSKNEVRVMDVYFLDKVEAGLGNIEGIPISTIILGAMSRTVSFKGAKKALPYARVLTRIFEHFGVDLTDEPYMIASNIVNQSTIKRIAYRNEQQSRHEEDGVDEEQLQSNHGAGSSQSTSRPNVDDLLQTILNEVRGTRAVVESLDARVTTVEARLCTIQEELEAWSPYHRGSK